MTRIACHNQNDAQKLIVFSSSQFDLDLALKKVHLTLIPSTDPALTHFAFVPAGIEPTISPNCRPTP